MGEIKKDDLTFINVQPFLTKRYQISNSLDSNISLNISSVEKIKNEIKQIDKLPKKYIINENAAICFWRDGTKTISKRHEHDEFDKEIGFLFCCYQHYMKNWSRNKRKKIISWFKYEKVKEFLFNLFVEKTGFTVRQAQTYLKDLKVEQTKPNINKLRENIEKAQIKSMKEVTE